MLALRIRKAIGVQRLNSVFVSFFAAVLAGACASPSLSPDLSGSLAAPPKGHTSSYVLSGAERKLPCSKLNGRIQMRIIGVRHERGQAGPSSVSQSLRSTAESIGIWSNKGAGGITTQRRDLALIHAYNQRLAELKCPTFDVKAELAKDNNNTPKPRKTR